MRVERVQVRMKCVWIRVSDNECEGVCVCVFVWVSAWEYV